MTELTNLQKEKIFNIVKCHLCNKILYQPITLHCQDTFCKPCLKTYSMKTSKQECPKCHKPAFYQPVNNFKLWDLINKLFPDVVKAREEEIKKFTAKLSQVEEIKEEIIKNNWRDVINKKQSNQPISFGNQIFIEQLF